jgi:hypothetical protein
LKRKSSSTFLGSSLRYGLISGFLGGGKVIETAVYKIKISILQVQNSLLGLLEKKN